MALTPQDIAFDLGPNPVGTPPNDAQKLQLKQVLGITQDIEEAFSEVGPAITAAIASEVPPLIEEAMEDISVGATSSHLTLTGSGPIPAPSFIVDTFDRTILEDQEGDNHLRDRIGPFVTLAWRSNSPFNVNFQESSQTGNPTSPAGTLWAVGWDDLNDIAATKSWGSFQAAGDYDLSSTLVGRNLLLWDLRANEFHQIQFSIWGSGGSGTVAYSRRRISPVNGASLSSWVNYEKDGDYDTLSEFVELRRGNQGGLFNQLVEEQWGGNEVEDYVPGTLWADVTGLLPSAYASVVLAPFQAMWRQPTVLDSERALIPGHQYLVKLTPPVPQSAEASAGNSYDSLNAAYHLLTIIEANYDELSYQRQELLFSGVKFERPEHDDIGDTISEFVELRRNEDGQFYNAAQEDDYDGDSDDAISPAGTLWTLDTKLEDFELKDWLPFEQAVDWDPEDFLPGTILMRDVQADQVWLMEFHIWTDSDDEDGAAFGYTRTLLDTTAQFGIRFADGTRQRTAGADVTVISHRGSPLQSLQRTGGGSGTVMGPARYQLDATVIYKSGQSFEFSLSNAPAEFESLFDDRPPLHMELYWNGEWVASNPDSRWIWNQYAAFTIDDAEVASAISLYDQIELRVVSPPEAFQAINAKDFGIYQYMRSATLSLHLFHEAHDDASLPYRLTTAGSIVVSRDWPRGYLPTLITTGAWSDSTPETLVTFELRGNRLDLLLNPFAVDTDPENYPEAEYARIRLTLSWTGTLFATADVGDD